MLNTVRLALIVFLLVVQTSCSSEMRHPAVAGQFYPGDTKELSGMIDSFLKNADIQEPKGEIYGIIVPHAGYVFSGQVAAYGFKLLEGRKIDTVILIGGSHHEYLEKAAVYNGDGFTTPLGDVPTDRELIAELLKTDSTMAANNQAHVPEHSLEVELPFLQTVLQNFKIVPILVNSNNLNELEEIAETIVSAVEKQKNKKVIFVISSDMSHYPDYNTANTIDKSALAALKKYDPVTLVNTTMSLLKEGHNNLSCIFCGESAVLTGMYATKLLGADKVEIIHYANSGDIPVYGDKSRVVGYSSVAFIRGTSTKKTNKPEIKKREGNMSDFSISDNNQRMLLDLARRTIKEYLKTKKIFVFTSQDKELLNHSAVFVTLNKNHQLRGCIGTTIPQLPLYQAVQQMAIASATEDYRFGPVTDNELKDIKIEISVLSPMTRIKSPDEIKQNVHGVVVRKAGRSGLFLPQVWEHFTTKEEFMSELCYQKAGLPPDAWKNPETELYTFTVFAFEDK